MTAAGGADIVIAGADSDNGTDASGANAHRTDDGLIRVGDESFALREALSTRLEITALGRAFVEQYAAATGNDALAAELAGLEGEAARRYLYDNQIVDVLHAHRRYNIYEEELWQGSAARLRMMISMPRIREWWADNQPLYAASFRTHVNAEIEDLAAQ